MSSREKCFKAKATAFTMPCTKKGAKYKKMKVYTVAEAQGVRKNIRKFEYGENGIGQFMQGLEIKDKCI